MLSKKQLEIEKAAFRAQSAEMNKIHKSSISAINKRMDDILDCLMQKNGVLTFQKLKELPERKIFSLSDKINVKKIKETENNIIVETFIEPGGTLGLHYHDCFEVVEVIFGHLIDTFDNNRVYNAGEKIVYAKLQKHQPRAEVKSKYIISFIK